MTTKKPIVIGESGIKEELQAGDVLVVGVANPPFILKVGGFLRVLSNLEPTMFPEGTISSIKCLRQTAGVSGSTIIDINKNGVTIFTTQANRPTFLASDGDNKIVTPTPDVTAVSNNDIFTLDIDAIESGNVETMIEVQITL